MNGSIVYQYKRVEGEVYYRFSHFDIDGRKIRGLQLINNEAPWFRSKEGIL